MCYRVQGQLSDVDFNCVAAIEALDALLRAFNLFLEESPEVLVFVAAQVRHIGIRVPKQLVAEAQLASEKSINQ